MIEDYTSIAVIFYDGTEYDAELVGSDDASDLAVLKIDAENLTPIELGDSDALGRRPGRGHRHAVQHQPCRHAHAGRYLRRRT
ncbi:MAG: trypsin-like peptidase domain-containing protein [Acutalibacteraceae bacterium]